MVTIFRTARPKFCWMGGTTMPCEHNIVNGLKWGPDGWLYGRHGIMASSAVSKTG